MIRDLRESRAPTIPMQVIKTLVDLCFFKARAEELPYSILWLSVTAVALFICNVVAMEPTLADWSRPLEQNIPAVPVALVMVTVLGGAVWLFLRLRFKTERFVQTTTGIYGTTALLRLISWPISEWNRRLGEDPNQVVPMLLMWLLALWALAVTARILRDALEVDFMVAVLYTLGAEILTAFGFMLLLMALKVVG